MAESQSNRYLDFLGAEPPDLEALVAAGAGRGSGGPHEASRKDLIACAILEAGRPLALADVASRLRGAGLRVTPRQLSTDLRREKRPRSLIVRGPGETLDLDLHAAELDALVWDLGLRPEPAQLRLVEDEESREPGDEDPLTIEELQQAFGDADLGGIDGATQAAVALDAHGGGPMKVAQVESFLADLTSRRQQLLDATSGRWADSPAKLVADDDCLELDRENPRLRAARRKVRAMAASHRETERELRQAEKTGRELFQHAFEHWNRDREIYRGLRRGVLHVLPDADTPQVGALLEFQPDGTAQVRTFLSDELDALCSNLERQDTIAGQDPRASLHALGLDAHRPILLDLAPESWEVRPKGRRHVTRLDRRKLLRVATGHRIPRGRQLQSLLADTAPDRLRTQLRTDTWALATMYRLGVLHRGVSFESGMHSLFAPTVWGLPGEPDIAMLVSEALSKEATVAVRTRHDVAHEDPWSRAQLGRLVIGTPEELVLEGRWGRRRVETSTVADMRLT